MSARVPVFIKVEKIYTEWIEVQAVTIDEAIEEIIKDSEVVGILETSYEKPKDRIIS